MHTNTNGFSWSETCIISPSLTTPSEATEKRSVRTSHRYEFRVLLHCTKAPLPDQSLPFSPKEEGSSGPGGGQQYKSKHFAGEPYSSHPRPACTLLFSVASATHAGQDGCLQQLNPGPACKASTHSKRKMLTPVPVWNE